MELTDQSIPAARRKQGVEALVLTAGKHLKIETSPGGGEILDVMVPEGETWHVGITVVVTVES